MQSDGGRVEDSFDSSWHWPKIAALSLEQQSLVLLAVPPDTQNKPLRQRLASRLQKSMTPQWFSGGSLAELFAVLCSLQERAPQYIGGTQLAYAAKRLVVAELSVGGPYMSDNGSPDVLTNARVALCLQRAGAPLPKVLGYLRNQLAAMYLPGPTAPLLAEYALWQVVVRLTDPTLKAVMRQRWQLLPVPPAGSLEALLHTDVSERLRLLTAAQESATDVWAIRHTAVFGSAKQQLLHLPATFQSLMLQMLEKIKKADHNYEIALLPAFFAADKQAAIAGEALEQLSAANIFAWMAYIIYDDFVD